jgi:hypothetical protein
MFSALGRIEERFTLGQLDLNGLVTTTEDLLVSEHSAWTDRMTQTLVTPACRKLWVDRRFTERRSRWIALTRPSVPMMMRHLPPGSLDPKARKDLLIHAHAVPRE